MAGQHIWNAGDGLYGTAADWSDGTAPATGDGVLIEPVAGTPPAVVLSIAGGGVAGRLVFAGRVAVSAHLAADSLTVAAGGALVIGAGGQIDAGSARVDVATLQVAGSGSRLSASGTLGIAAIATAPGSGSVLVSDHATVALGALLLAGGTFALDGTAVVEIGSGGLHAPGLLIMDANGRIDSAGGLLDAQLVSSGTLEATAGRTTLLGPVSGPGTLQIGLAGTLNLLSSVDYGSTIAFSGTDGMLQFALPTYQVHAVVTGFALGDAIGIRLGSIATADWTGGVLTLSGGGGPAMALRLIGDYGASRFIARPDGTGGSIVILAPGGGGGTGSGQSGGGQGSGAAGATDRFAWAAPAGGDWGSSANWTDLTAAAQGVPGAGAQTAIAGPAAPGVLLVTGSGEAAALAVTGAVGFDGRFTVGTLMVGDAAATGMVDLRAGGSLDAGSLGFGVAGGLIDVAAGASLGVDGGMMLGSGDGLVVAGGGTARLGGLTLDGGGVSIDYGGQIEIGQAGAPEANWLSIDFGATLVSRGGLIVANLITRGGFIALAGSTELLGYVAAFNPMQIEAGATLSLFGATSGFTTLRFEGGGGTLRLGPAAPYFAATIAGLLPGDTIDIAAQALTDATILGGTLSLGRDGVPALSFTVPGIADGRVFLAMPDGAGGTALTLAAGSGAGAATAAAGSAAGGRFTWQATGGGDWDSPANWTGATIAPGRHDSASIDAAGGFQMIGGRAQVADLTLTGGVGWAGTLEAGGITVGLPGRRGLLDLVAGAAIAAGSVAVGSGLLQASGVGARLTVAGLLTAETGSDVVAANHAAIHVGGVTLAGGTLEVDPAGVFDIGAGVGAIPGVVHIDAGATLTSGGGLIAAPLVDDGTLLLTGGATTLVAAVTGAGVLRIADGATLTLSGAATGVAARVQFAAAGGVLRLVPPPGASSAAGFFPGRIDGFAIGAVIDLAGISLTEAHFSAGSLALSDGGGGAPLLLALGGSYDHAGFLAAADGQGGTAVSIAGITAPCFVAGTRIRVPGGETAVEALQVGDLVVTLSGRGAPLKRVMWIGWRRVELDRHPRPADAAPICIDAHAFGPGMPQRPLLLSPDHAVHVAGPGGGVLVPVRYLVNGATIRRAPARGSVLYFHVELAAHDLLLAEGLPAESYLDTGNRDDFANGGGALRLHMAPGLRDAAALRIWRRRACAPLLTEGPALARIHARLSARAASLGWHRLADPALRVALAGVPMRCRAGYAIAVPAGATLLRLLSRTSVPAEMGRAADHRRLGVAVTGLKLDGTLIPLDGPACGAGWHAAEPGLRWTGGDAALILPPSSRPRRLVLTVRPLLEYWWQAPPPQVENSPRRRRAC